MSKRKIIYESEDDDVEDRPTQKSRAAPDPPLAAAVTNGAGARRSDRAGKGSGGRLAQMKQFEQLQIERSLKRPSKIDLATQGESINPMAPSSQDTYGSRKGRVRSSGEVAPQTQEQPLPPSPQPEFLLAGPGQQFGFRIPDAVPQPENNTRAPTRTRFSGVHSQTSSQGSAPSSSSRSASLFSNGRKGSTVATSCAPSVCSSSSADRYLARQDVPTSCTSSFSQQPQQSEDAGPVSSRPPPMRLQRTASFYDQPLQMHGSGHTLFAAPDLDDGADLQIDEASPSEDDRMAEANLHRGEYSRGSPPPDHGHLLQRSPSPDSFPRGSPSLVDDSRPDDVTARAQSARLPGDQTLSQARSRFDDDTMRTHRQRNGAPDNDDGTSVSGATSHANQRSQHASHRDPVLNQPSSRPEPSENIVNIHRRRNHAPRLPSNAQLLAARQRQQAPSTPATGETPNNDNGQERAAVDPQIGPVAERTEPWQLQHYDPATRDVIERAKQYSHCDAASINPFPIRAAFNSKAVEYIDEAIIERQSRGLVVSEGWWPQQASSISRLLWEDLGSWRSALRKKARTFVTQRYQWDPENRRDRNIQIAKDLLGSGGLFLRDGVDAEGHVNNLAHPALSGLIIDFFYTGPASVGKLFPEVFAAEVPRVAVALAATALKVVLDEAAVGQGEVNFRVPIYSPVYSEILGLMNKCDTSAIHRAKTSGLRERWAQLGSNGMDNQGPVVGGCGFDVELN